MAAGHGNTSLGDTSTTPIRTSTFANLRELNNLELIPIIELYEKAMGDKVSEEERFVFKYFLKKGCDHNGEEKKIIEEWLMRPNSQSPLVNMRSHHSTFLENKRRVAEEVQDMEENVAADDDREETQTASEIDRKKLELEFKKQKSKSLMTPSQVQNERGNSLPPPCSEIYGDWNGHEEDCSRALVSGKHDQGENTINLETDYTGDGELTKDLDVETPFVMCDNCDFNSCHENCTNGIMKDGICLRVCYNTHSSIVEFSIVNNTERERSLLGMEGFIHCEYNLCHKDSCDKLCTNGLLKNSKCQTRCHDKAITEAEYSSMNPGVETSNCKTKASASSSSPCNYIECKKAGVEKSGDTRAGEAIGTFPQSWASLLAKPSKSRGKVKLTHTNPDIVNGKAAIKVKEGEFSEGILHSREYLVGCFVGKRLAYPYVKDMLTKLWDIKGDYDTSIHGHIGTSSFARVCIDIQADCTWPSTVPIYYGEDGKESLIKLEYAWIPIACKHYKLYGHTLETCDSSTLTKGNNKIEGAGQDKAKLGGQTTARDEQVSKAEEEGWSKVKGKGGPQNGKQNNSRFDPLLEEYNEEEVEIISVTTTKNQESVPALKSKDKEPKTIGKGQRFTVERACLWSDMITFSKCYDKAWVVVGDFNSPFSCFNKTGGRTVLNNIVETYTEWMDQTGLMDMRFRGCKYTWCNRANKKEDGILTKIDRCLVNEKMLNLFGDVMANFLTPGVPDHSPIWVRLLASTLHNKRTFKYYYFWAEQEGFKHVVENAWSTVVPGNPMLQLYNKLGITKAGLKVWRGIHHDPISKAVIEARETLTKIQE
ncbi:hypothetical protein GIB67_040696 [Kingdonia uniflora]|uniref:Uncharacterized protein n=1 Tax=Kingdonia uniflora TaxID=39325 RepID=A0A7J7KUC6_9MAGN|nr:hypothetical protein GIB67_040696 [Kingdonia uniflora]